MISSMFTHSTAYLCRWQTEHWDCCSNSFPDDTCTDHPRTNDSFSHTEPSFLLPSDPSLAPVAEPRCLLCPLLIFPLFHFLPFRGRGMQDSMPSTCFLLFAVFPTPPCHFVPVPAHYPYTLHTYIQYT